MCNLSKPKIRNFHGFHQYLEDYFTNDGKIRHRWVFYVCGFSFCDTKASVLKFDGSKEFVPIDDKDRILINGKRYGRRYWNH